ncbi:MAG TPA: IPT/TIG domain-containing protein [Terriglobales bacterium]|nr:IPT/TIG domain-containing protein [Terriglobales bacterium]
MSKLVFATVVVLLFSARASAGGPAYVAGASFFDPSTIGTPITWPEGIVNYYTDQGDLSTLLPGASADTFVASAFTMWTSVPTAAVSAVHGGQLAENVSGSNISVANGAITTPADITPGATTTPVGIVYDEDGSVTDALLGSGASASIYCADNGAFGGVDNLGSNAQFQHALIILNGNCAQSSSQLPDLQYHLVRIIGRVLGLDWSQANLNVVAGNPPATADQIAGFPVMHEYDPPGCVPVANCYSSNGAVNPAQPKTDDQAALSRLYPVTAQNISSFTGKQVFSQTTARIHGSVYFSDANGAAAQPMQGVSVVARLIDPSTNQPSGSVVVTSISGFLFCGNAGNIITGYTDSTGANFNQFGSNDQSVEGFFDLAGLPIPAGASNAQYQLSVEAVDPLWSTHAGPYGSTSQVEPSGSFTPILVTVTLGGDVAEDILMQGSAVQKSNWYGSTSYASPGQLPTSGNWAGVMSAYGDADFFEFPAQANRSLSVIVNAIDESSNLSESKALPVIGMWALADPGSSPAPANTPSAFNTVNFGETRLDAQIFQSTTFRVGITDYRGDGRPDYRYNARVLYGDNINPARASAGGGTPLTIQGLGLQPNTTVQVAGVTVPVLGASATQLLVNTGAGTDGTYDVLLQDSGSGGQSDMSGVLTIGAGPTDTIKMITGANPATAVGGQAPVPFAVQVLAADGITPVGGASVQLSSSPAVAFSACSGGSSCTVLSDQSGMASTFMTVLSANVMTLTAKLAPASYSNPQQVQATLLGTSSQLDLALITPPIWIAQGATVTLPIQARVMSNGTPVGGTALNFQITAGSGTLSANSVQTAANGNASASLQVNSLSASVRVTLCVAQNNSPCQVLNATMVQDSSLQLQPVSGMLQIAPPGQNLQPVSVRVVDSDTPSHPVLGANVSFLAYIGRMPGNEPIVWAGGSGISQPVMPVILAESQTTVQSDVNGLANFAVSTGGISGNAAIVGSATAGNNSINFEAQQLGP